MSQNVKYPPEIKNKKKLDEMIDEIQDPDQWIDLVNYICWFKGQTNQEIPIKWARERIRIFLENKK
jgi:hypothetical protein